MGVAGDKVAQAFVRSIPSTSVLGSKPCDPCGQADDPARHDLPGQGTSRDRTPRRHILADYASDDPDLVANLLMDADPTAYAAFFPIAQEQAAEDLPLFQAEIDKKATFCGMIPPLDPAWTKPDTALAGRIEWLRGC